MLPAVVLPAVVLPAVVLLVVVLPAVVVTAADSVEPPVAETLPEREEGAVGPVKPEVPVTEPGITGTVEPDTVVTGTTGTMLPPETVVKLLGATVEVPPAETSELPEAAVVMVPRMLVVAVASLGVALSEPPVREQLDGKMVAVTVTVAGVSAGEGQFRKGGRMGCGGVLTTAEVVVAWKNISR